MPQVRNRFDVIIVGQGLAGAILAWQLRWRGVPILAIDPGDALSASRVAAGLITPISGQRFTHPWRFHQHWQIAGDFYRRVERETGTSLFEEITHLRVFNSDKEKQLFDKRAAARVLDWPIRRVRIGNETFHAPHGAFEFSGARLDTNRFLDVTRQVLEADGQHIVAELDVNTIDCETTNVRLRDFDVTAESVVFCQGHAGASNPLFDFVVYESAHGETVTLEIPNLKESRIMHGDIWLSPIAGGRYLAGGTYDRQYLEPAPTPAGLETLSTQLSRLLNVPFEIVEHHAGVRPTVTGRRPIIGRHPSQPRLSIFNGLGSAGTLNGPAVAEHFCDVLFNGKSADPELDVLSRFNLSVPAHPKAKRLTVRAHELVHAVLRPGEMAIDATAGNGNDTVFLAETVGPGGSVYAFDIQADAIRQTGQRLKAAGLDNVHLLQQNHRALTQHVPDVARGRIGAVMFNLGYLPGGDKSIVSEASATVAAIEAALALLRPNGILTIMLYPGHPGGDTEAAQVTAALAGFDMTRYDINKYQTKATRSPPPVLYALKKKR